MPFAGFASFNSCVQITMRKKGWGKERASAYCASIMRKVEGKNIEGMVDSPQPVECKKCLLGE